MNPIIYASSSREFKRAFARVLRCKFKHKPRLFLNVDNVSMSEFRKWSASMTELRKISTDYRPRVSISGSQQSCNEELLNIHETNFCGTRRNSDSPVNSLRVLPNHRASFSQSVSNRRLSEQPSSASELADDENSDVSSFHSGTRLRTAVVKISSHSQIGSFTMDEDYIDAFKNGKNHTVL